MDIIDSANKKYHGSTSGNLGSSGIIFDKIKELEDDYGITRDIRINRFITEDVESLRKYLSYVESRESIKYECSHLCEEEIVNSLSEKIIELEEQVRELKEENEELKE